MTKKSVSKLLGRSVFFLVMIVAAAGPGRGQAPSGKAAEWPGLWGPNRDARVAGPLTLQEGMQVREVWRRPLGKGFSEVAVAQGRGYTMFSDGEVDHLTDFEVRTGKEVWRARLEATHRGHDGSEDGPISTPVVGEGRVFALDPFGRALRLRCGERPAAVEARPPGGVGSGSALVRLRDLAPPGGKAPRWRRG